MSSSKKTPKKATQKTTKASVSRSNSSPRLALFVLVVAFAVYANTLGHEFLWDDLDLIVQNSLITTLDGEMVGRIFTEDFWQTSQRGGGYYRPLVTLSYHLHHKVFDGNPSGFHFVNVMWNAIVCMLVFVFVNQLFRRRSLALTAALVFALHPLHTENVAWVSGRTDVLAVLWALFAMILYVAARRTPDYSHRIPLALGSIAAFFLALLAKESVAPLPLILLVMEIPPCGKLISANRQILPRWLHPMPYFVVIAVYLGARSNVLGTTTSGYEAYAAGALGAVALPLAILGGYVWKLLVPLRLSGEWDVPVPESFLDLHVIGGLIALAAIVYGIYRYRHRADVVLGAAIFLLGLGPVINLIPIGEISAERFAYFPSLGFALVLAGIFAPALELRIESLRVGGELPEISRSLASNLTWALVIILAVYTGRTFTRNNTWSNEVAFFTATAEATPNSARAHLNVGNAARRRGQMGDAVVAYRRAIEVDSKYADALANLAGIFAMQGKFAEAEPYALRALEAAPENVTMLTNMAVLRFQQGRHADAIPYFESAIERDPNHSMARYNLGICYFETRNYPAARGQFVEVAGINAFNLSLYYLAVIENASGNTSAAKQYAQSFLSIYPKSDQFRRQAQTIAGGR